MTMQSQREFIEQVSLFTWARASVRRYPALRFLYSSQNGLPSTARSVAKAKRAGLVPGVSDVHLPVARGGFIGLWIELKVKPNRLTGAQRAWLDGMQAEGHRCEVAWSFEEARDIILDYLNRADECG